MVIPKAAPLYGCLIEASDRGIHGRMTEKVCVASTFYFYPDTFVIFVWLIDLW